VGRPRRDQRSTAAFPQARNTFTNLDTGTTITVNVSGPGEFTDFPDTSFTLVGRGLWIWGSHPETGELGLFQTAGRFILSVDRLGNEAFQIVGTITDLCSQLVA
jgi:hypothetical protein